MRGKLCCAAAPLCTELGPQGARQSASACPGANGLASGGLRVVTGTKLWNKGRPSKLSCGDGV